LRKISGTTVNIYRNRTKPYSVNSSEPRIETLQPDFAGPPQNWAYRVNLKFKADDNPRSYIFEEIVSRGE